MYPTVSIVTINYNQTKLTCELLESLRKVNYPSVEVIVVDNHSKEDPTLTTVRNQNYSHRARSRFYKI